MGDASNFATCKVRFEIRADNNGVLEYIQGRMLELPKNASACLNNRYKKGESKEKKIIVDGLQDHLLAYVGNLIKYKDMYDNISDMYEISNLNDIITLKDQLKEMNMNKGEVVQSYNMRISRLIAQL